MHKDKANPSLSCSFSCQYGPSQVGLQRQEILDISQTDTPVKLGPHMMVIPTELELDLILPVPKILDIRLSPIPCCALSPPYPTVEARSHVLCL